MQRGYLKEVSVANDVYVSPLLPIRKPNGTFCFTNNFRKLNSYFPSEGTTQVDVWRKIWEVKPEWRYFMEIDLKDGFFGIPVDEELSKPFGFTYGVRRFCWGRLPQGWKWSSVLFGERVAEISGESSVHNIVIMFWWALRHHKFFSSGQMKCFFNLMNMG